MSEYFCFIDFGSTYTKVCIIDPNDYMVVAWSQAPTTVATDITIGLEKAMLRLNPPIALEDCTLVRATSSAAGGLKLVAVGLVPDLTAEAANRAALGAGAKVLRVFSYRLTNEEVHELDLIKPDIVLLAGGTDGGNRDVIVYNARRLAACSNTCPVIMAGNKEAADEIEAIFVSAGRQLYITDNVMPEIGKLSVDPAREKIRSVFLKHIVHAKGLSKANKLVDDIIMPTPMAVLKAATVFAEEHLGSMSDVLIVDVGGATTDVHSAAKGDPSDPSVVLKGLPEPFAKRTVEGDLGIRVNAPSILQLAEKIPEMGDLFIGYEKKWAKNRADYLSAHINSISKETKDRDFDLDLARAAITISVNRHVGRIETIYTISGATPVQIGKDLTRVCKVIGTGGIFTCGFNPTYLLEGTKRRAIEPVLLKPEGPGLFVDNHYILFAAGLLSEVDRKGAAKLIRQNLIKVQNGPTAKKECL